MTENETDGRTTPAATATDALSGGAGLGLRTHDFSGWNRRWGHDYTFRPVYGSSPPRGMMMGWGYGLGAGDYLILDDGNGGTTRYQIDEVSYFPDPGDMWSASVTFAPRTNPTPRSAPGGPE